MTDAKCYLCGKQKKCTPLSPNQFEDGEEVPLCDDCIGRSRNLVQELREKI